MLTVHTGNAAEQAPAVVVQALGEALRRGGSFAAVVSMPVSPRRGSRLGGAVERVRMLKALRPGLVDRCRGLAFVVPVESQQDNAKAIRSGDKIWGCPTLVTDDLARATSWAMAQLSAETSL